MDYRNLENGKYVITLNVEGQGVIRDGASGEIMFVQSKDYILTVKDGVYYVSDDYHTEEQAYVGFSTLEWFNVRKM